MLYDTLLTRLWRVISTKYLVIDFRRSLVGVRCKGVKSEQEKEASYLETVACFVIIVITIHIFFAVLIISARIKL